MNKKICLIGDIAVGKTSLVRRFVERRFDETYINTIGVVISRKSLALSQPHQVSANLLIWDMAGDERFDRMMHSYYLGAAGALLVCDLTRQSSAERLEGYAHHFRAVNPASPMVLIGNKADLEAQRSIPDQQLNQIAAQLGTTWFTSSAKTGEQVDRAFQHLTEQILVENR